MIVVSIDEMHHGTESRTWRQITDGRIYQYLAAESELESEAESIVANYNINIIVIAKTSTT